MATIKAFIRIKPGVKVAKIRLRLTDGRSAIYYGTTSIEINPDWWDVKKEEVKQRVMLPSGVVRDSINKSIAEAKIKVLDYYSNRDVNIPLSGQWISDALNSRQVKTYHGDNFIETMETYIREVNVSESRKKQLRVVRDMLVRFSKIKRVKLNLTTINEAVLKSFEEFLRTEHLIKSKFSDIYKGVKIVERGQNTINTKIKIVLAFVHWAQKRNLAPLTVLQSYKTASDVYGDPIPLLPEELDLLFNLKDLPKDMELVRDLFCLQCFIGCRIGDFVKLTKNNVDENVLVYVAEKTIEENPVTIYVPLVSRAISIIEKYGFPNGKLMPFININGAEGMNKQLKQLCERAELFRSVVVINTITRKSEVKRLCDIVSTHTARKTFINSVYQKTQDQALISKMTGHAPNSVAFARYRNIEIETLRNSTKKAFEE